MAMGYYIDPVTGRYEYGEHPSAKPSIQEAMKPADAVDTDYSSVGDAGELSEGVKEVGAEGSFKSGAVGAGMAAAQGGSAEDIVSGGLIA